MKFRTQAQSHSSKITAEMTGNKKEKANTGYVSTTTTLTARTMNRNFTVCSAKVKNP
jgi:predicted chitinase